jgi:two-component system chemotaxis response regulator CheY
MKVIVVEDNELYLKTLKLLLSRAGYDVRVASGISGAFAMALQEQPDLIITDYNLGDGTGLELVERLSQLKRLGQRQYVVMSGRPPQEWRSVCEQSPASHRVAGFLQKPFTFAELQSVLTGLVQSDKSPETSEAVYS